MKFEYIGYGSIGASIVTAWGLAVKSIPGVRFGLLALFFACLIMLLLYTLFAGKILELNDEASLATRVDVVKIPLTLIAGSLVFFCLGFII